MTELTRGDTDSWFETIWDALHGYREDCIPEGDEAYDDQWSDICTAMAWLREEFDEDHPAQEADRDVVANLVYHSIKHHQRQLNFIKWHHELEEKKERERIDSLQKLQKSLDL
jgi:hypothetical protein